MDGYQTGRHIEVFSRNASPENRALVVIIDGNVEPALRLPGRDDLGRRGYAKVKIDSEKAQFVRDIILHSLESTCSKFGCRSLPLRLNFEVSLDRQT